MGCTNSAPAAAEALPSANVAALTEEQSPKQHEQQQQQQQQASGLSTTAAAATTTTTTTTEKSTSFRISSVLPPSGGDGDNQESALDAKAQSEMSMIPSTQQILQRPTVSGDSVVVECAACRTDQTSRATADVADHRQGGEAKSSWADDMIPGLRDILLRNDTTTSADPELYHDVTPHTNYSLLRTVLANLETLSTTMTAGKDRRLPKSKADEDLIRSALDLNHSVFGSTNVLTPQDIQRLVDAFVEVTYPIAPTRLWSSQPLEPTSSPTKQQQKKLPSFVILKSGKWNITCKPGSSHGRSSSSTRPPAVLAKPGASLGELTCLHDLRHDGCCTVTTEGPTAFFELSRFDFLAILAKPAMGALVTMNNNKNNKKPEVEPYALLDTAQADCEVDFSAQTALVTVDLRPGDLLFGHDDPAVDVAYLIRQGQIMLTNVIECQTGEPLPDMFMGPGQSVGMNVDDDNQDTVLDENNDIECRKRAKTTELNGDRAQGQQRQRRLAANAFAISDCTCLAITADAVEQIADKYKDVLSMSSSCAGSLPRGCSILESAFPASVLLRKSEVYLLLAQAREEKYSVGDILAVSGQTMDTGVYIIRSGKVLLTTPSLLSSQSSAGAALAQRTVLEAGAVLNCSENEFMVVSDENGFFPKKQKSVSTAQVLEDCRLLVLSRASILNVIAPDRLLNDDITKQYSMTNLSLHRNKMFHEMLYPQDLNSIQKIRLLSGDGQGGSIAGASSTWLAAPVDGTRQLLFVLKQINKCCLYDSKTIDFLKQEKNIMLELESPFILRLFSSFQTFTSIYFVLQVRKSLKDNPLNLCANSLEITCIEQFLTRRFAPFLVRLIASAGSRL